MSFVNITNNVTELSNTSTLTLDNVIVSQPTEVVFEALFSSGISVRVEAKKGLLAVVFAGPVDLMGQTRGLLGVWDQNPDNDLTTRNGSVLSSDASDRAIHFQFGLSWEVDSNESLFYYSDNSGPSDFSFPEAIPLFFDEVNLTAIASPELVTACGGDPVCLFDGGVTGDIEVASQSVATEKTNEVDVATLDNTPPVVTGNETLFAFINDTTAYLFTVIDANDTFNVTLRGSLPSLEEYTFTRVGAMYNFTWTPMSTKTVSIQFLAIDSAGAPTLLHPLVRLCACHQELNATCSDGNEDPGENRFILQSCSCGPGYGGRLCGEDIDGCNDVDCFPGVECTDNPAPLTGATCGDCPNGTLARNDSCEDLNECRSSATNDCDQVCSNSMGSYSCHCNAGYTLNENGRSCNDINECADLSRCHQICNNSIGSFSCACYLGFELDDNGVTCSALEMCREPVVCEQLCAVGRNGDNCYCNQGFEIDSNSHNNCSDINECAHENGNNCDQLCINTVGSFVCSCRSGYILNADGHSCDDVNECIALSKPCSDMTQICHNTDGAYRCDCPSRTFNFNGTCRTLVEGETPPPTEPPTKSPITSRPVTFTKPIPTTEAAGVTVHVTTTMLDTSLGEVNAIFANLTVAQFNETKFKKAVAEAVFSFCNGSEDCLQANKKDVGNTSITVTDVIVLSVIQAGSDVITTFYIFSPNKATTVSAMTVLQALQTASSRSSFEAVGLSLAQISVVNLKTTATSFAPTAGTDFATKGSTLSSSEKASIIGGTIGGVMIIIAVCCVVYFIMSSKKRAKVKPHDDSSPYELPLEPIQSSVRQEPIG